MHVCQETHFHSRQVHVARTLRHLVYTRIIRVAEPVRRLFISARIVVGYACPPFQRGMFACIHLIPRIRTIKGGKFWNVEQRKNTWSNRRARGEKGLRGYFGTVILLLWLFFFFNPDRIKGGCERFTFSRMRGYGTKMTNIWRRLKRAQNMN